MTVAVQDSEDEEFVYIYCKGADSSIYNILGKNIEQPFKSVTTKHLHEFSCRGFRTLGFSVRAMAREDFDVWNKHFNDAKMMAAGDHKEKRIHDLTCSMEANMFLLGASALEDQL